MDKSAFLHEPEVSAFIAWLGPKAERLPVRFAISPSRYAPGGLRAEVLGLEAALSRYTWRTESGETGDWQETKRKLRELGHGLRSALDRGENDAVMQACLRIIAWGGDRDAAVGAGPFLAALHERKELAGYLSDARQALRLEHARLAADWQPVRKMNSMLTKVHALAADDGLPIYDSRVAAAIATLVEMWRRERRYYATKPPPALAFPATLASRTLRQAYPGARGPGLMSYEGKHEAATARKWSGAKVRLGWLMQEVLARRPALFAAEGEARDRMHAFEAALFMVGYDVACMQEQEQDHEQEQP